MTVLALGAGPAAASSCQPSPESWQGVGRLWLGNGDVCGASLVMPGVAATAAHCLFDQRTGEPHPVETLVVQLDWRNGAPTQRVGVSATAIHPDFLMRDHGSLPAVAADAALLALVPHDADGLASVHYPLSSRHGATSVTVVSVAGRVPCEIACGVQSGMAGVMALECQAAAGSSGAPVVTMTAAGRPRLTGVVSASGSNSAGPITLVSRGVAELVRRLPELCRTWPSPRPDACYTSPPRVATPDWSQPSPVPHPRETVERDRPPPPPRPAPASPPPAPASEREWWVAPSEGGAPEPTWAPPDDPAY